MLRSCIPILFLAVCSAQDQHTNLSAPTAYPVGGVSIPAELTSTIRAERVHRGDPVEFRTLEAVLISKGIVMPANAKLTGRIVGAAPLQDEKPSWLVLLVERGEWKTQSIPLHAFIAAQITVSQLPNQSQAGDGGASVRDPRRAARQNGRVTVLNGGSSASTRSPEDSRSGQSSGPVTAPLKDLQISRDTKGITYLVSQHTNVKLPGGTLFRLQNEPPPASPAAEGKDKPGDAEPSPQ